jgi:hypothetical protein
MSVGKEVTMGLIRKLTYVGTGGLIDIRSDSDRIASYSKKLMKERENASSPVGRGPGVGQPA